jgi:acetyltransferase
MSVADSPARWTRVAHTLDGVEYRVRPIHTGDPLPADYQHDMAFVAVAGEQENERIIGVARYAPDNSDPDCQFAVCVEDAWQARGVGPTLTRLLFDFARTQGFHRLHGDIMVSNERTAELADCLGMAAQHR